MRVIGAVHQHVAARALHPAGVVHAGNRTALGAEHRIAAYFGQRSGPGTRLGRVLGAWLVLFLSKFVILEAIDIVFSDRVDLGGLAWVIALSVTLVAVERATLAVFRRL